MLGLRGRGTRLCDGINRREFLRVGALGLGGLTWPALLQARSRSGPTASSTAAEEPGAAARPKSCIQLFMWGGPSQQETFDLKPNAPDGVRGLFRPIATRTPGIRICEHLPLLARMTDRFAIVRSLTHTGVNHGTSAYHMLTGHIHFTPGTLRHPTPSDYPSIGCAVARFGRQPADMPPYVALPSVLHDGDGGEVPGQGPGLLGQRAAPFLVDGDPTRPDFSIDTLILPAEVGGQRFRGRIGLHAALDHEVRRLSHLPRVQDLGSHYERAFRLLQSPAARRAFNLAAEPAGLRDRYGRHHFGQSCLLARRLVEAGVPLVTVYWNSPSIADAQSWDTHTDSFNRLQKYLLPAFDRALTALLEDLHCRGLIDDTLVVWAGEFGRTPRINRSAGRDHWGFCQSAVLAGAGIRGGQVYGSSDAHAAYAAELPVSPDDLAATIFHTLGVPLNQELVDAQGRPLPLCTGRPVLGLT
jgi:hypothetical protein